MIWLILDAIPGHAPRTEREDYGEVPPDVMLPEILKYPKYKVVGGERRDGRRGRKRQQRGRAVEGFVPNPTCYVRCGRQ
jgi:hypothetical protein